MEKMTKREMFTAIKANLTDEAQIAFIDHEIALLDKKSATKSKASEKAAEARAAAGELVVAFLQGTPDQIYTATELSHKVDGVGDDCSTSKMVAILKPLVADGVVKTIKEKSKTYYQLA